MKNESRLGGESAATQKLNYSNNTLEELKI